MQMNNKKNNFEIQMYRIQWNALLTSLTSSNHLKQYFELCSTMLNIELNIMSYTTLIAICNRFVYQTRFSKSQRFISLQNLSNFKRYTIIEITKKLL